jgi:hypothetical protein
VAGAKEKSEMERPLKKGVGVYCTDTDDRMRKVTRSAEERVRSVGNMIIRSIVRRDRDTRSERGKV